MILASDNSLKNSKSTQHFLTFVHSKETGKVTNQDYRNAYRLIVQIAQKYNFQKIDLHGFSPYEGENIVRIMIEILKDQLKSGNQLVKLKQSEENTFIQLVAVVGKGIHSPNGICYMKKQILRFCVFNNYQSEEIQGMVLIKIPII